MYSLLSSPLSTLVRLSRVADQLPLAPVALAREALFRTQERQREIVESDSVWQMLEESVKSPQTLTWQKLGLLAQQEKLENSAAAIPVWVRVLGALSAETAARTLRQTVSRVMVGWSEEEVYCMSYTLPQHVGHQLLWLSKRAKSWPASGEYASFNEWTVTLAFHGNVLVSSGYLDGVSEEQWLDRWNALYTKSLQENLRDDQRLALSVAAEQCRESMDAAGLAAQENVAASLRWVADNHALLWD